MGVSPPPPAAPSSHPNQQEEEKEQTPSLQSVVYQHDDGSTTMGLIHYAYQDDALPDYLQSLVTQQQAPPLSPSPPLPLPVCEVHISSPSPSSLVRVERVDGAGAGMRVDEVRVEEVGGGGGGVAALRLLCSGRRAAAYWPPAPPAPTTEAGAMAEAPSQLYEEFHARSESIRSLLFDHDPMDAPAAAAAASAPPVTAAPAASLSPPLAAHLSASSALPNGANEDELPPLSELQHSAPLASHLGPSTLAAAGLAAPPKQLDMLPAIRTIVSDPTVLPPTLAVETPMATADANAEAVDAGLAAAGAAAVASAGVAPIVLPSAPAATSDATSDPSGADVQPLILPTPNEWSPPDAGAVCTPQDLQHQAEALPRAKLRLEEKESVECLSGAATASLASALNRFLTPPLPSSAPIKRALTASAASSPLRSSLTGGVGQQRISPLKPYQHQHPAIILSRRGSAGSGGRPSAPSSAHESDSPRRASFPPPPPLGMLRQRSLLNLQQAAAAGISPFRSHARASAATAAMHGHGHSLSSNSISNVSSAAPSPSAHRARCPPMHPFVESSGALLLGGGGPALDSDMAAALSLLKAQLDEVVERRVREVRREMEELASAQLHQCAMAMQAAAANAAAAAAASTSGTNSTSASHSSSLAADSLQHVTPFQVPSAVGAVGAVGEQPSGAHPFIHQADVPVRLLSPMPLSGARLPSPRPSPSSAAATVGGAIARQATPTTTTHASASAAASRTTAAALTALLTSPRATGPPSTLLAAPSSTRSHPSLSLSRQPSPRPFAFAAAPASVPHALLSPRAQGGAFVFPHATHPALASST